MYTLPDHMITDILRVVALSSSTHTFTRCWRLVCKRLRSIVDGEPHAWGFPEKWVRGRWQTNCLQQHTPSSFDSKCLPFSPIVCRAIEARFYNLLRAAYPPLTLKDLPTPANSIPKFRITILPAIERYNHFSHFSHMIYIH
jgi:hypothetical protein